MRRPPVLPLVLAAALALASARTGAAQPPPSVALTVANPSFEALSETRGPDGAPRPLAWAVRGTGYELSVDTTQRLDGAASLRSRRTDTTPFDPGAGRFGVATQSAPHAPALGRTLRLTGWIRTENVSAGSAGLWLRVDGGGRILQLDNMSQRGARGTTPWTRYVVELPVDSGATGVCFGVLHPGSGTAWFDSLRLEVVGPTMARRVATPPQYVAPPRPTEDPSRLLSDADLAPAPDSAAPPPVDSAAAAWVRANARPLRSLGARDFADLAFLRPLLDGRRIVQLGESGHGVREFNLAKVRLIQYLHEALGYDVLAFESSLFACDRAGRQAVTLTTEALMRGCIFGVWHTEEVLALFDYVRETQRTTRPLVLTGFDVQTSGAADSARSSFLRRVVGALDTAYAARVYATDAGVRAAMQSGDVPAYARSARERLVAFYDSLTTWIAVRERQLAAAFPDDPMAPALARQTARSLSQFVRQRAAGVGVEGTEIRDRGMADNLDFVLDELHPGRKVIVWAHNFHIQHRGHGGAVAADTTPAAAAPRTMGTWVAERRRSELYTVGLFMYRGSAALNTRVVYPVSWVAPGSLEAILHRAPWKYAFVDLSRAAPGPGTAWMSRRITAKEWGTNSQLIVPRAEYDGLLFIDTTWPPEYVQWRSR